jgi:hypothetical protein
MMIGDRRIEFCCLFADFTEANLAFWAIFGFANEVHFYLNGTANKHNSWIRRTEIPNVHEDAPLHPANCTVWCALSAVGIVGLALLQQNVTSERRWGTCWRELFSQLHGKSCNYNEMFLQYDGARPRTDSVTPISVTVKFINGHVFDLEYSGLDRHCYLLTLNPWLVCGFLVRIMLKKSSSQYRGS